MKELFKYLVSKREYLRWFVNTFKLSDFQGIDCLFYVYLEFCNYLGLSPADNLESYFATDALRDIKKYNIKLPTQTALNYDETVQLREAVNIIKSIALSTCQDYLSYSSDKDFTAVAYEVMDRMKKDRINNAMLTTFKEITDGEDVNNSSSTLVNVIKDVNNRLSIKSLENIEFKLLDGDEDKMKFVAKTGMPCIDGDIGGIYSPLIYTLNSQPGGGKTRFSLAHFAYPVMLAGKDVLFYELELSVGQTKNILLSHHISKRYGGRIKIPDTLLNKFDELSDEQKHVYEAAKEDLFNERNGSICIETDLVAETCYEDITFKIKQAKNIGLIVIDYAGLVRSEPQTRVDRRLDKTSCIDTVYETVRRITKEFHIPAVMINQFNDAGIEAATAGKMIKPGQVQGGHNPGRYTDYDLNLTYTQEQKLAGLRTLSTAVKTRGSAGFPDQVLQVDLSISMFRQLASSQLQ